MTSRKVREKRRPLWLEFTVLVPQATMGIAIPLCGLCGNSGWVDTTAHVLSPRGVPCGIRATCICPNGRAIRRSSRRRRASLDRRGGA
jgi:hypothetical protein